jgi:hypothetical protein
VTNPLWHHRNRVILNFITHLKNYISHAHHMHAITTPCMQLLLQVCNEVQYHYVAMMS